MERQLFDWISWDQLDTFAMQFYDVTLKVDIGDYKAGTHFDCAAIDFGEGTLELYENTEPEEPQVSAKFSLELKVK